MGTEGTLKDDQSQQDVNGLEHTFQHHTVSTLVYSTQSIIPFSKEFLVMVPGT